MKPDAARLLAPAIVVLLAAGIVAAAVVGGDDDGAAAPASTTTSAPDADADADADDDTDTDTSTSTASTATTGTTTGPGGTTSTTRPTSGGAAATTTPVAPVPTTGATTPATAAPAGPADLILHVNRYQEVGRVRFSVENAGPGAAPGIVLTLTGVPGDVVPGDGVTCEGSGTVTCRVAASGTGGLIGFVEVPFADGCPSVVASVASTAEDPDPASNARSRGVC